MSNGIEVRKYTLVVKGDECGIEAAVEEATRLMNEGYMSGQGTSGMAGFYFDSTTDVPKGEWPR